MNADGYLVTWNGVEYNSIMIGDETSGYQESDHSAISQNEDTCHWSAPFGHETSSESPPEAEDQHSEEGVFPFEQHSTSTPPETAVHTQLSSETLPGQSPSAPLGENAIGGDGRRPLSGRINVKSKIGRSVPEGGANSSGGHLNASAPR